MPCPADRNGDKDVVQIQRFQLVENNNSNHVNCTSAAANSNFLTASKLTPHHLPIQSFDITAEVNPLTSNGAFWSPLKAIPLASYYKLHRVPSLSAMTEPDADDIGTGQLRASEPKSEPTKQGSENGVRSTVKLPRRESTAEPPERLPENGLHNKILDHVVRTPGRQPSPQPTHLSVPGLTQHKLLHEEGSGYVAPRFDGKELQMDQGMPCPRTPVLQPPPAQRKKRLNSADMLSL